MYEFGLPNMNIWIYEYKCLLAIFGFVNVNRSFVIYII